MWSAKRIPRGPSCKHNEGKRTSSAGPARIRLHFPQQKQLTRIPDAHAHHPARARRHIDLFNNRHLLDQLRSLRIAISPMR